MLSLSNAKAFMSLLSKGEFHELQKKVSKVSGRYLTEHFGKKKLNTEWNRKLKLLKDKGYSGPKYWWQDIFLRPTYHLKDIGDPNLVDIFTPLYDSGYVDNRLHEQFRQGAEHHSEYYYMPDWYHYLIERALNETGFDMDKNRKLRILDVGAGAGNTTIPLINIFPNAEILATELSIEMLVQLRKWLEKGKWEGRCSLLQLDAENLNFKPESFDLIVGGAILHHLFHPEITLNGVAKVLKPGGTAIFFEPFSPGNMLLAIILQVVMAKNITATEKIPPKMEAYLHSYLDGVDTVWGTNKSDPKYLRIDDKWMFPKHYFMKMASDAGFTDCELMSLHGEDTPFRSQMRQIIAIYGGVDEKTIPSWVWGVADEYDKNLSLDQKRDLIIEACAILKKRPQNLQ